MRLRSAFKVGLLGLLLSPLAAEAQSTYVVDDAITNDASGSVYLPASQIGPLGAYFWARGDFGDRPGADGNYFSTGAFAPMHIWSPHDFVIIDGQIWLTEQKDLGGDIGLGYRTFLGDYAAGAGVNAFITGDHSFIGQAYRRMSFGAEFFTNYLGVTANAYLPWDNSLTPVGGPQYTGDNYFEDHLLYLGALQLVEQQMRGADIEVGTPIPGAQWLSVNGGAYYLSAPDGTDTTGVSGRAVIDLTSAVLDFTVQNDKLFGTSFSFGAEFRLGNGPIVFTPRYRNLQTKMYDRVRKRSRISTSQFLHEEALPAINPADLQPWEFIHVDNTAAAGGDGTDENRFNNLGLATGVNGDIILVHRGTTNAGTLLPAGNGLTLQDGQMVLGEGVAFQLPVANAPGPISLPDWDTGGASPFVTGNANSNIITLANNNTVNGLNMISPAGGNMIVGSGISNFVLRNINLDVGGGTTGPGGGIWLTNATGTGIIQNYSYRATNTTTAVGGIAIRNTSVDPLNLTVNNTGANFIEGGRVGVDLRASDSTINATLNSVFASENGTGLRMTATDGGLIQATANGGSYSDAVGNNILVQGETAGRVTLNATGVDASRSGTGDNLHIELDDAQANLSFTNSQLDDAGDDAIDAILDNGAILTLNLQNTTGDFATSDGLAFGLAGGSSATVVATGSTFTNAGDTGLFADISGSSTFNASFTNGDFSDSGEGVIVQLDNSIGNVTLINTNAENTTFGDAFRFDALNGSRFTATLSNVSFDNSAGAAIRGNVDGATSQATITGGNVSGENAFDHAIDLNVFRGTLTSTLAGPGSFANAGGDGLHLVNNRGTANVTFNGGPVDFSDAGGIGLYVHGRNDATTQVNFSGGANFNHNLVPGSSDAMRIESISGASTTVTGSGVSGENALAHGIRIVADDATANLQLTNTGSFANAGGSGIRFMGTNGANINVAVAGTGASRADFSGAQTGAGIRGTLDDSTANVTLSQVNFDNSAHQAIDMLADNGSQLTVGGGAGVSGAGAGLDAIRLQADNASTIGFTLANAGSFEDSAVNGINFSSQNGSDVTVTVSGGNFNDTVPSGNGVLGEVVDASATVNLTGSSFNNAGQNGFLVTADNSTFNANLATSTFNGAGATGIELQMLNGSSGTFVLNDTDALNAGGDGLYVNADASQVTVNLLNGPSFNGAGGNAILLTANLGADMTVTGSGVSGSGAGADGIHIESTDSVMSVSLTNLGSFANAGDDGVDVTVNGGSHPDFFLNLSGPAGGSRADFSGADNSGLRITLNDYIGSTTAGNETFIINRMNFNGAGDGIIGSPQDDNGFSLLSTNSVFNGIVTDSTFDNATQNGWYTEINGALPQSLISFTDSTMTNSGAHSIQYFGDNGAQLHYMIHDGDLTGSTLSSIDANLAGGAVITGDIDPTPINRGVTFDVQGSSTSTINFLDSPLTTRGVSGTVAGTSTAIFNFTNSGITANGAGQDAFNVTATGGSVFEAHFNNSAITGSGGQAVQLNVDNSTALFDFNQGSTVTNSTLEHFLITATNGATANFDFDSTSGNLNGAGADAINATANSNAAVNFTFTGAAQINNAVGDAVHGETTTGGAFNFFAQNGLQIQSAGGSGIYASATNGGTFDVRASNFNIDNSGDDGLTLLADGGSTGNLLLQSGTVQNSGQNGTGHGIRAETNADVSANDSSKINLTLNTVDILNNIGDGLNLAANDGNNVINTPPTSGIILSYTNGNITGNRNPDPPVINGIGYGISATANGGGVPGDTTIVLSLNNVNISTPPYPPGNEEGAIFIDANNGGVVIQDQVGGTIQGPVVVCAEGAGSTAALNLDNVLIIPHLDGGNNPDAAAIVLCALDDASVFANFSNMTGATAISGHGAQAVAFLADTGGQLNANFNNVEMTNNLLGLPGITSPLYVGHPDAAHFVGFGVDAVIQGRVQGTGVVNANSVATVNFTNVNVFDNVGKNGFQVDVDTGGQFVSTISNMTLANNDASAGEGEFQVTVDDTGNNGSSATLNINGLTANGSDGHGVNIVGNNGAELNITQFNNVNANNAAENGVNILVDGAGSALADLAITNSHFDNAGGIGINVQATNGATMGAFMVDPTSADNAGAEGLNLIVDGTSTITGPVTILDFSANNAGQNVVADAINIDIQNTAGAAKSISLTNVTANGASGQGVDINLVGGAGGGAHSVTLSNVDANGAQAGNGLDLTVTGLLNGDAVNLGVSNGSSFNTATTGKGMNVVLDGAAGSNAAVNIANTTANSAGTIGMDLQFTGGISGAINSLDNVSATGAGTIGLNVDVTGASILTNLSSNTADFSNSVAGNGVNVVLDAQAVPATIAFANLTANNAGGEAIHIELDGVTGGASSVSLTNVSAQNAQGGQGLNLDVINLGAADSVALTLSGNFSGAFDDDININLSGAAGSTATLAASNVTANDAGNDGFDLTLGGGIAATVTSFDNVSITNNDENGMKIDVTGGSVLTNFVADGMDLSNNATTGAGFDALDINVSGVGSAATFNLSNFTANNSGGRGIDLDVHGGGSLTFNITGGTNFINNSGLQGIDLNVGLVDEFGVAPVLDAPGTFVGTFTNVAINGSGQSITNTADGVNVDINGAGTTATVTFNNVDADGGDEDGFDVRVLNGASGTINVTNNSSGSGNAGTGLRFVADGGATTASLNMTSGVLGTNVFNNNVAGSGVNVTLTNGVTVNDLVINAQADNNGAEGIRVVATDNTGVSIANFNVAGGQANGNTGSGLMIDLNNVAGISSFALQNASYSANGGDQVFVRFQNFNTGNGSALNDVTINNLTVTGTVASGDGIELNFLDSEVTGTLGITGLIATGNGGRGLNLIVDESTITGGARSNGIATGFIRDSQFSGNGLAGARLQFGGDLTSDFDIFDNAGGSLGFNGNTGAGLEIEVQDNALLTISGQNSQDANPLTRSFYNNTFSGNQSFGMIVTASEPDDANPLDVDNTIPTFDIDLGDVLRNPNTFTGNSDAALAVVERNDAVGTFAIRNSVLTGTLDGANANFDGDGLVVDLSGRSSLTGLTVDGSTAGISFNSNAGSGIVTKVSGEARLGTSSFLTITNTTITGNGLHGIDIRRSDNGLYGPNVNDQRVIVGTNNNGNTISGNTGNGLNIVNSNQPGVPFPLWVQVEDNTFNANQDGIFLRGTGNAQFTGIITDNIFTAQTRDGIHVQLENDATLGDPDDDGTFVYPVGPSGYPIAANGSLAADGVPVGRPFEMNGNQISGSTRNGIFFDTNAANESGLFSGGAFVNVLIQGSTDHARTLITGSTGNGVQILDNSDFFNGVAADQNTYAIRQTDITLNTDGVNMGIATVNAVSDNNGPSLIIGDPDAPLLVGNRDVVIENNRDDGIDITVADGDNIATLFRLNKVTLRTNGFNGDGVRAAQGDAGHGMEIDITGSFDGGRIVADFQDVDILGNHGDGMDWLVTSNRAGNIVTTTMHAVTSSLNGERGLDVFLHHDPSTDILALAANNTVWNIGTADRLTAADQNHFNQNLREGVVFDLRADSLSQNTIVTPVPPSGIQTENNVDVYVNVNQGFDVPQDTLRSTTQPGIAGLNTLASGQETRIHLEATVNFINNETINNGGFAGFEDGLDLGVSALARMNATIAGNTFGGNVGDDIRIFATRPMAEDGTLLNPPNSVNNLPPAQINGNDQNYYVYDPVAYFDLVFGSIDTDADDIPDFTLGNTGNQIAINTLSTNQVDQIVGGTGNGIFDNDDPVKGSGGSPRQVAIAGQVQIDTIFDNPAVNDFFQNSVQQNILQAFDLWTLNPATLWPDNTFPP